MKFKIEITFSGLCLFVRVPASGDKGNMAVLLPQTPLDAVGSEFPRVPEHHAHLTYPGGGMKLVAHQVSFPALTRDDVPEGLRKGVVDLTSIHETTVKPFELGETPGALRARVLLRSGELEKNGKIKKWKIGKKEHREMTDAVLWEIEDLKADDLVMRITDFAGNALPGISDIRLEPDWNGVAHISLKHHCDCTTSVKCPNYRTPHFRTYYTLLQDGDDLPLPTLEDCPAGELIVRADRHRLSVYEDRDDRTSLFTCMVAGAQPSP